MPTPHPLSSGFQFGEWVVKPADGSLSSSGATTRLEPLLMDLLVFLCSRSKQVVTKDETLKAVWHGRFVSDDTVKASFYQLRKALGDSPRKPRYIETLPKRGYRVLVDPVPLAADTSTASHEFYRKGTAFLSAEADLKQARVYLERAVEANPAHAEALAALAHVYIGLTGAGLEGRLVDQAISLATRAVEIAPSLARAHSALAIATLLRDRDVPSAECEFRKAIELDPGDAVAHGWYAKLLSFDERHDAAVLQARSALETDPLSLALRRDLVETLFVARRYPETLAEAQHLLQLSDNAPTILLGLSWVYYIIGDQSQAFDAVYRGFRRMGIARSVLDRVAAAFRHHGMDEVFRAWAGMLRDQAALGQKSLDLLVLSALLGDADRAFDLIDEVLHHSHPAFLALPASPIFDKIRADHRFREVRALTRRGRL